MIAPGHIPTTMSADKPPGKPVILNACLSHCMCLMTINSKDAVLDAIIAAYDFLTIKEASELIHKYSEPDKQFRYKNPNNSPSERAKAVHVFKGLFTCLQKLDAENKLPVIACPSEQLHLFLRRYESGNVHLTCDVKIQQIQILCDQKIDSAIKSLGLQMDEIKKSFNNYNTVISSVPHLVSSGAVTPQRSRAGSVRYPHSPTAEVDGSVYDDAVDASFTYPRSYQRKLSKMQKRAVCKKGLHSTHQYTVAQEHSSTALAIHRSTAAQHSKLGGAQHSECGGAQHLSTVLNKVFLH